MLRSRVAARAPLLRPHLVGVAVMAAMVATSVMSGCYKRVVKESGIGTGSTKVYEPNVPLESDDDPWNLEPSSRQGIKNWKSASQTSKPSTASDE